MFSSFAINWRSFSTITDASYFLSLLTYLSNLFALRKSPVRPNWCNLQVNLRGSRWWSFFPSRKGKYQNQKLESLVMENVCDILSWDFSEERSPNQPVAIS